MIAMGSLSIQYIRPDPVKFAMDHPSERLANVQQIQKLLNDVERRGLWKATNTGSVDQATIESARDEILRDLTLVETELERAGLWDRRVDAEDGGEAETSQVLQIASVTLPQIAALAAHGVKQLQAYKPP
jgi:hypothetical protein